MSCYIIIRGPSGVGKTTVAKRFAKKLSAYIVSLDEIMAKHKLDTIVGGGISTENFIKGNELMLDEVEGILEKGGIVIMDACFYRKGHLDHLIRNLPYRHFIFTLKASVEECMRRNERRGKSLSERDIAEVHRLVSGYEIGIPIDAENKTAAEIVEEMLVYMKNDRLF